MNPRKSRKPSEIVEFEDVFEEHPPDTFVGRKWIFKHIDDFLHASEVKSPFLLIQGESGIGKTALMANYVRDKRDDFIHYFIQYNTDTVNPQTFIDHLYYVLGWKHALDDLSHGGRSVTCSVLKNRIWEVSKHRLRHGDIQAVFIDALDDSLPAHHTPNVDSILTVFNTLKFPNNYRVVISSSRHLQGMRELLQPSRCITPIQMTGRERKNKADVARYFKDNLPLKRVLKKDLKRLIDASEGNFQYAIFAVQMASRKDIGIDELLQKPPEGLFDLYDDKLQRLEAVVGDDTYRQIWDVMRLIAVLGGSLTLRLISDILGIDRRDKHNIFTPIEAFFNPVKYRLENRVCTLFHKSFCDYVMNCKWRSKSVPSGGRKVYHLGTKLAL